MKKRPQKAKLILPDKEWLALEPMGSLYTSSNPFVRWLFLSRLKIVLSGIKRKGSVILDLGTGNGVLIPSLSEVASWVIGLDNDEDTGNLAMVRTMADSFGYKDKSVYLVRGDAHNLPLANGVVDYVLCVSILDHLGKLEQALDEIRRVLKPDGKLIVGVIPVNPFIDLLQRLWEKFMNFTMRKNPEWEGHIFGEHVNTFDDILFCINRKYCILKIKRLLFLLPWRLSPYVAILCQQMDLGSE